MLLSQTRLVQIRHDACADRPPLLQRGSPPPGGSYQASQLRRSLIVEDDLLFLSAHLEACVTPCPQPYLRAFLNPSHDPS